MNELRQYLSCLFSFLFMLISTPLLAQEALDDLIRANSFPLEISDTGISGPGSDSLLKAAKETELFLFGENHGIVQIANFSHILYKELSKENPRYFVTEIGPATASKVEEQIRNESYESYMDEGVNLHAVPFFFLKEEVPILKTLTQNFPNTSPVLWGLDQEFVAGAPVVFDQLESVLETEAEKEALEAARRSAFFNPFLIGMGEGKALEELHQTMLTAGNEKASKITGQLVLSHKIYIEQMGGDSKWSNTRREDLMMENFLDYVEASDDSSATYFFKFGAYHLHRGKSPTVERALGLQLDEWAQNQGMSTSNIFVDAIKGETLDALLGGTTEISTTALWMKSPFGAFVEDKPMLFSLAALRGHPELEETNYRMRLLVEGYDYLLLLPEGSASEFLEGTLVTHAYGAVILVLGILLLVALIYGVVKLIKRIRKRRRAGV
ncbi:MAG: hypothetical protein R8P61_03365 [Bacteroidia bacterium]|nr:hypothetical protein [Bacteroidia bacterium]